jgi:hypothetical protein
MSVATFAVGRNDTPPLARHFLFGRPNPRPRSVLLRAGALLAVVAGASALNRRVDAQGPHRYLSLIDDYPSLYHAWMIGYLWARVGDYLDRLSISLSSLVANAAAHQPSAKPTARIRKANQLLRNRLSHVAILLLAIATCIAGTYAYSVHGAFGPIGDSDRIHMTRYTTTWATFPRPGFFGFVIVSSIGAYLIYWIAYATIIVLGVWVRSRRDLRLQLALECPDGLWGWGNAAALIDVGSKMLTVNIVGLAAIAWRGGFSQPQYFAFFPMACIAGIVPYVYSNRLWADALNNRPPVMGTPTDRKLVAMSYVVAPKTLASTRTAVYQVAFTILPGIVALVSEVTKK